MNVKQEIMNYYYKANERGRTMICAIVMIMSEGNEEEKRPLQALAFNRERGKEVLNEIYDIYHRILQKHIA